MQPGHEADSTNGIQAVHVRHLDVHEDHVGEKPLGKLDPLDAARGTNDLITLEDQVVDQTSGILGLVINDQDEWSSGRFMRVLMETALLRRSHPTLTRFRSRLLLCPGKNNSEPAPLAALAFDDHAAAVQLGQTLHECQAQPGSLVSP